MEWIDVLMAPGEVAYTDFLDEDFAFHEVMTSFGLAGSGAREIAECGVITQCR